jgi:hypothetical protein
MSPDDLWALGYRANDATGYRPRWLVISYRQIVCDLGHLPPIEEAQTRAAWGMTLPQDPLDDETWAQTVERLRTPEGDVNLKSGPFRIAPASRTVDGHEYFLVVDVEDRPSESLS